MKASSGLAENGSPVGRIPSCCGSRQALRVTTGYQIAFRVLIYLTLAESWNFLLAGSAGLVASLSTSCLLASGLMSPLGSRNAFDAPLPLVLACCAVAGGALAALVSPALFRLRASISRSALWRSLNFCD